jgi:hypothetical protein
VKTGVQEIHNGLKMLDSGFRRNDGKSMQAGFFTASERVGKGGGDAFDAFFATFK